MGVTTLSTGYNMESAEVYIPIRAVSKSERDTNKFEGLLE